MDLKLLNLFIPLGIALLSVIILLIIRNISFRLLNKWAKKTETDVDNIIITSFKTPSVYWCIAIGLYIGVGISDLPDKYIIYISKVIHIIVILSVAVATANLSGRVFTHYIQKSNLPIPTTGLAYGILKGTIILLCPPFINASYTCQTVTKSRQEFNNYLYVLIIL